MVETRLLRRHLVLSEAKTHPVLDALGGAEWLDAVDKASMTAKEARRRQRVCRKCGMLEMQKMLSLCGGCRMTYYW